MAKKKPARRNANENGGAADKTSDSQDATVAGSTDAGSKLIPIGPDSHLCDEMLYQSIPLQSKGLKRSITTAFGWGFVFPVALVALTAVFPYKLFFIKAEIVGDGVQRELRVENVGSRTPESFIVNLNYGNAFLEKHEVVISDSVFADVKILGKRLAENIVETGEEKQRYRGSFEIKNLPPSKEVKLSLQFDANSPEISVANLVNERTQLVGSSIWISANWPYKVVGLIAGLVVIWLARPYLVAFLVCRHLESCLSVVRDEISKYATEINAPWVGKTVQEFYSYLASLVSPEAPKLRDFEAFVQSHQLIAEHTDAPLLLIAPFSTIGSPIFSRIVATRKTGLYIALDKDRKIHKIWTIRCGDLDLGRG